MVCSARLFCLSLILFLGLGLAPAGPAAADPAATAFALSQGSEAPLNALRRQAGSAPLAPDPQLAAAAADHAAWMHSTGQTGHAGRGGLRSYERALAAGYCPAAIAENIAWGQASLQAALSTWAGSGGHRRNMVNRIFTRYGLARAEGYWVLILGGACVG